jgi:TRAP-type C4-dicarboxylate transport system permease small subunit
MNRPDSHCFARTEQVLLSLATRIALLGGAVLIALAGITVYSVVGRWISRDLSEPGFLSWWRPIRGDFELIEMGTAVAIFAFLPYTQMVRGNVVVDFFTSTASPRLKAALAIPANLLFSALAGVLAWRMITGTVEQYTASFTQTTMLLRIPLWWGYLPAALFVCVLALVSLFTVWRSAREALADGEPSSS